MDTPDNSAARAVASAPSRWGRFVAALAADRKRVYWILILFLAALIVRLHWNLIVHPLGQFLYSDMKGYWGRADRILDNPLSTREYDAFFPFGTAWLVTAIKFVFGRDNIGAFSVIYAIFGATIVGLSYSLVDRVIGERARWVAPAVGVFLVLYYPMIAIGGYVLSELPFSLCMVTCIYLLLRLVEGGRARTAWVLGLALGVCSLIRPQMIMHVALVGLFWLAARWRHRKDPEQSPYAKLTWGHIGRIAVPLLLLLMMASIRFHVHTGRYGLISENSSINLIFGRCHNKGLYARKDNKGHGTVRFSPPPLIQFENYSAAYPDALIRTRSIWGDYPGDIEDVPGFDIDAYGCTKRNCPLPGSEIEYRGYVGDRKIHRRIVRECIERGGVGRQLYFTLTHWVLLWRHNLMWPDQANPRPRSTKPGEGWRPRQELWARIHRGLLMVPALLALGFVFVPRRRPISALIALNLWALLIVTGIWIGGVRFRVPYDPVIIMLAGLAYGEAWLKLRAWRERRRARKASKAGAAARIAEHRAHEAGVRGAVAEQTAETSAALDSGEAAP